MKTGYVYFIRMEQTNLVKIGWTRRLPSDRMKEIQAGNPIPLILEFSLHTNDGVALEKSLHDKFCLQRVAGEWFNLGSSEERNQIYRSIGNTLDVIDLDWMKHDFLLSLSPDEKEAISIYRTWYDTSQAKPKQDPDYAIALTKPVRAAAQLQLDLGAA